MNKVIIRVGEIWIKGKNRKEFMTKLGRNMRTSFSSLEDVSVFDRRDKFIVEYKNKENKEEIHDVLSKTFGIEFYSDLIQIERDFDLISSEIVKMMQEKSFKTFKVESKRKDKTFEMDSNEIKRFIATKILKEVPNIGVDLHNPEIIIYVNVDKTMVDIYFGKNKGPGGLPVGSNGKVLLMLSGGIDSPVAAIELMKRGMSVDCVTFLNNPVPGDLGYEKILKIFNHLKKFDPTMKHFFVNFSIMQATLQNTSNERYKITLLRRAYVRASEEIAKNEKIMGIATGDALGQVASQTLESLSCVTEAANMLILRPLLTRNKIEIIKLSKNYNLYNLSIGEGEDMCKAFTPKQPVTKPKLGIVKFLEDELNTYDSSFELTMKTIKEIT